MGNVDKEGRFFIAVSAIIENKKKKILITRRSREREHSPGQWEFVTGRAKQQEKNLEETLKREILEEVGLNVEVVAPFRTFYFEYGESKSPHFGINFFCKYYGDDDLVRLDMSEQDNHKWVDIDEADRFLMEQDLRQALGQYKEFRQKYSE